MSELVPLHRDHRRDIPGAPGDPGDRRRRRPGVEDPLWRDVLGHELRRRRHRRGETLGETADRAGLSPQYLSEIERGRKEPSSEMIAAVAGALDVTLVDLTLGVAEDMMTLTSRGRTRAGGTGVLALAA